MSPGGAGTWLYKERKSIWKGFLAVVEALLYVAFMADCFVLIAGTAAAPDYFPPGGLGLIPILLLAALVDRLRTGRRFD